MEWKWKINTMIKNILERPLAILTSVLARVSTCLLTCILNKFPACLLYAVLYPWILSHGPAKNLEAKIQQRVLVSQPGVTSLHPSGQIDTWGLVLGFDFFFVFGSLLSYPMFSCNSVSFPMGGITQGWQLRDALPRISLFMVNPYYSLRQSSI